MSRLNFSNSNVLVIGDVILDRYFFGDVKRISPEAPVPVLTVLKETTTLGGAANVVHNIYQLRGNASLVGVTGADENEQSLKSILDNLELPYSFIQSNLPTTTKIRVIGDHQQILRVDFEEVLDENLSILKNLQKEIDVKIQNSNIVVLSDYGKGVCSKKICRYVIKKAEQLSKKVIIDPKGSKWKKYKGAFLITPNLRELREISGENFNNLDNEIAYWGKKVREKYSISYLLVTRSEKGMSLIGEKEIIHIPTHAKEVFDVSGAGDTVVAVLAAALGEGYSLYKAIELSNKAAGIVVGKLGTAAIRYDELQEIVFNHYPLSSSDLEDKLARLKEQNLKIVFTNGCFDILHKGHVNYLKKARELGDFLVVGLNSDESVRVLKGESRPINNQEDRKYLLEALDCVDAVVIFNEETPYELIKSLKPNILVKGGDYKAENVVGKDLVQEVKIIPFVKGYSTSSIIEKSANNKES